MCVPRGSSPVNESRRIEGLSKSLRHQRPLEEEFRVGLELVVVVNVVELYLPVDLPFFPELAAEGYRVFECSIRFPSVPS